MTGKYPIGLNLLNRKANLCLLFFYSIVFVDLSKLMQTLNQHLTELKFMTLDLENFKIQDNLDFSIVSRLEQFTFNSVASLTTMFNLLSNHNGPNLRSIEVYTDNHTDLPGKHLYNFRALIYSIILTFLPIQI